jgi:dienelactone hydrolase
MRVVLSLLLFLTACSAPAVNKTANSVSPNANSTPVTPSTSTDLQTVSINSSDGVKLVGSLYNSEKPNSPAVVLLHQWESDRHSYDEFAKRMASKGFNVLSIDGRGFGESTKKVDGSSVAAGRTDADVKGMLGDVDAAVGFLMKQPNVDPKRIAIVGASYGSSLAIIYAADHPDIHVVALLSPGLNYFGNIPTRPAVEKYGERDLFIIASKGDTESAKAVDGLTIGTPKHGFMVLPVGSYHGTDLFKYREKSNGPPVVEDALESFLTTRLGVAEAPTK